LVHHETEDIVDNLAIIYLFYNIVTRPLQIHVTAEWPEYLPPFDKF